MGRRIGLFVLLLAAAAVVPAAQAQTSYALTTDAQGKWLRGFYPLYEALARGDLPAVKRLTPQGEAINAFGEAGATPLSWLLTTFENTPEDLQILAHLLESGADPNQPDAASADGTPQRAGTYLYAGRNASAEATRLLLAHGMTFDTPAGHEAIVEAAAAGNMGFLRAVRAAGQLTEQHLATLPLLAVAALKGEYLTVGYLLDLGADPDGVRLDGFLPLHWAVLRDHPGVARRLLAAGADPAQRTRYDANPDFHDRTALELVDVLRTLQGAGPDDPFMSDVRAALGGAAGAEE